MFLLAMVYDENAYRHPQEKRRTKQILNKVLINCVIPFIYHNRVWTLDDSQGPITMEDFKELNEHLGAKLTNIHAGHQWHSIIYFFNEVERELKEWQRIEEMEKDVMETVRQVMEN